MLDGTDVKTPEQLNRKPQQTTYFEKKNGQHSMSFGEAVEIENVNEFEKAQNIERCLSQHQVNLWELRELALTRGGLINADTRKRAWLYLVGLGGKRPTAQSSSVEHESKIDEKELDLIHRDAGRSLLYRYYSRPEPEGSSSGELSPRTPSGQLTSQIARSFSEMQHELANVLERCVSEPFGRNQSKLHYYQGLHELAGVLMYNLTDQDLTLSVLRRICQSHLRDALREDFDGLSWLLSYIVPPLIEMFDEEVFDFLVESEVSISNCVLPWIITWFAHDVKDAQVASRLVDAFLCAHPLFPVYFVVALLLHPLNRPDILSSECDQAMVHMTMLTFAPRISGDWDDPRTNVTAQCLLDQAVAFMHEVPPRSLLKLALRSQDSVSPRQLSDGASSISLMKAPPSWLLISSIFSDLPENPDHVILKATDSEGTPSCTDHAKLASGVSRLMLSVESPVLQTYSMSRTKGAANTTPFLESQWSLCKKLLFSHWAAESVPKSPRR